VKNRFFTTSMMDVLTQPERWTIFGPYCDPPVEPVDRAPRRRWAPAPRISAPRAELLLVLRGRGWHPYRGRRYEYWTGTVFCYGVEERREAALPEWMPDLEILWAHMTARGLTARVVRCIVGRRGRRLRSGRQLLVTDGAAGGPNPLLYPQFIAESPTAARPLIVRAGVELLVASIVALGYEEEWVPPETPTQQTMRLVADFIQEVGGDTTISECARLAGCSVGHFHKLFLRCHGVYPKGYIDDYRITHADQLVMAGLKWKDIAAYFGQSPSTFRQWYKRVERRRPF